MLKIFHASPVQRQESHTSVTSPVKYECIINNFSVWFEKAPRNEVRQTELQE